ncbi:acetoacetate metabolism regulatory protein AtoC [Desulfuromonas versatilis]|uniref:Acetoacetate metabolism regulatory protein AtoC n=1 Tax=Desulfuromonas versatilis TaxID=2802975 RepID=A0ABM8HYK5_9BACT|nr:sigma-54 dependent transcriptional regulator [Desulfuromonas versatilis]BCR05623.1 acetoacetate metabolism regulatory protein AtoC [Desulfuromonas versatilis]
MRGRILIVEDEELVRESLVEFFAEEGLEVQGVASLQQARAHLSRQAFDLVILDLKLPDGSGLELLREIQGSEGPQVVVLTAFPEVQTAVRALKLGAFDYINKPFDLEELQLVAARALEEQALREQVGSFRQGQQHRLRGSLDRLVGASAALERIKREITLVAGSKGTTALVLGESGVGKELVAEAIHYLSERSDGPLLKVNCAAIPANLLESELFGHEKGAFTDAKTSRKGLFELAHRGTLFLDEVGEMALTLQAKLLRVLEDRRVTRLGGRRPVQVDVRIVAATNRNLAERVREGSFREDLFYRLNVFPLVVPPLRERPEDIPPLAELFLKEFLARAPGKDCRLGESARQSLLAQPWPGNVRELRNIIERTLLLHPGGVIEAADLPLSLAPSPAGEATGAGGGTLAEVEREHILRVYRQNQGNKTQTADQLGINRLTLRRKLKEYGVD